MAGIGLKRSRQAPAEETPSFGAIAERFRRAGDLDRAIALCEEGLKKFPNQLSARVTLGWSFLDKGEYDLARTELERVLRRAPDNLAAIRGLAELHDRAEHAVSSFSPDGGWSQEEAVEEPASPVATPVSGPVSAQGATPAAEMRVTPPESPRPPAPVAAALPPPLPIPAVVAAAADANPLSLIETPAQAAIAHSSPVPEATSVFEQMLGRAAEAVAVAPSAPEITSPPFEEIDPVTDLAQTEIGQFDTSAWEIPSVSAVADDSLTEPDTQPVLLADADIELAQVASELATVASEPVMEPVIDLPSEAGALEGALLQFEEATVAEPFDSSENVETLIADPAEYEAEALDPVLLPEPAGEVEAVEWVNDAADAPAIELEPEVEVAAEPVEHAAEPDVVADVQFDAVVEPAEAAEIEEVEAEPVADVTLKAVVTAEPEPVVAVEPEPTPEPMVEPEPEPAYADEAVAAFAETVFSRPVPVIERFEASPVAAMASAAAEDVFQPPLQRTSPPARPSAAAPLAALEAFLHKVSARRLHLTPGSVA